MNTQVDQIQVEMKEKLSHANRELSKMEQQYQREILGDEWLCIFKEVLL